VNRASTWAPSINHVAVDVHIVPSKEARRGCGEPPASRSHPQSSRRFTISPVSVIVRCY